MRDWEDDECTVTLTFRSTEQAVRKYLGDDFHDKGDGITTEGTASMLVRNHPPEKGYINWSIGPPS